MSLEKTIVDVPGLKDPVERGRSYKHCVTAGDWVFLAGQVGVDENHEIVSHEFEDQARATFENIETALAAAGSDLSDIVNMTVYFTDMRHSDEFLQIRKEILGDDLTTSAIIGTSELGHPDYLLEIEVIAVKSDSE